MINIPDRGTKCTCAKCAARFYDLNKRPGVCPKCGQKVVPIVRGPVRRTRRKETQPVGSSATALTTTIIAPLPTQKKVRWK